MRKWLHDKFNWHSWKLFKQSPMYCGSICTVWEEYHCQYCPAVLTQRNEVKLEEF